MSIKEKYSVKSIDSYLCKEWFLKKHYAKRLPMSTYCFQLIDIEKKITVGVCSFGETPSIQLNYSLSNNLFDVLELNRLVVNEGLEKNVCSFFVSNCLKMLPNPLIVVSFADISKNHHGYIYQATNWIYTGLNAERFEWKSKSNPNLHYRNIAQRFIGIDKKEIADLFKIKLSRKHRYVFFLGNKNQKKIMRKNLKYDIYPYPKGENIRYDASYQPSIQTQLF
jgi:hypothetical protein